MNLGGNDLKKLWFVLTAVVLGSALSSWAQSTDEEGLALSKVQFSGLVDTYVSKSFQNPATGTVAGRAFDTDINTFMLNMAKLEIEHAADPIGFRLDLGFGRGFEIFNGLEPGGDALQYIPQAYVSFSPKSWKGLQIDLGKFYTSAGAEPTESHLNWNYSRSRIYAFGPYFHMGMRVAKPFNDHFSAGFQLVNGWDSVRDVNNGKTIGLTSAVEYEKASWYMTYYGGPENEGTSKGWRNFYDTVLKVGTDKAQAYVNFDYGRFKPIDDMGQLYTQEIYAVAVAGRFHAGGNFYVSPRYGWYDDRDGWAFGDKNKLQDFTLTAEYRHPKGLVSMVEYRRDWATNPFFARGNDPAELPSSKSADTLTVGVMVVLNAATFGK
ncbi:MAG: porin [Bryobacterales bacterium]|nr:porin [Bryobacterales bacterium]